MNVQSEMERALRARGFGDGYAGRDKAFPKEKAYLDSYKHGEEARRKDRKQAAR